MIENIKDVLWIIASIVGTYKLLLDIRKDKKDNKKKKRPNRKKGRNSKRS